MNRLMLSIVLLTLLSRAAFAGVGSEIAALTGARTRVVWCQHTEETGDDTFARSNRLRLMGFDSEDGLGERAILRKISNYAKPLITPTGSRIIFSNHYEKKIYVVNWDGTELKEISDGIALEVWMDPKTSVEWVYIVTDAEQAKGTIYHTVKRHQIDNPSISELVWNKTAISSDNFQISGDGMRVGAQFPWPSCGVAMMPNESWQQYGKGCWPCLSPDNSYILWIFDGSHRNIYLFTPITMQSWKVNINHAPGVEGYEVYHPRWSNHVRFMTITGPYKMGKGSNLIRGGGPAVEIYLGRFDPTFTKIEKWVRVTNNKKGDFYPDAWIESGEKTTTGLQPQIVSKEKIDLRPEWPGNLQGLVFLWENGAQQNEIKITGENKIRICRVDARGRAKLGRYFEMDIKDGIFVAEDVDKALLSACKKTNQLTVEALITPDNLQQKGPARIISFSTSQVSRNFTLGQEKDNLIFRLRTPKTGENGIHPQVELYKVEAHKSYHVVVSYKPGQVACYVNGKPVFISPDIHGDFSNWSAQHLIFGDEWNGNRNWSGKLEGIAIYNRFMELDEARENYALYSTKLTKRKPIEQLIIDARLLEITPAPTPESIAPYRRALATYTYNVEKVISGNCDDKKIMVAHWVIMDGKIISRSQNKKGEIYQLTLESFDKHPQLQGERLIMDSDDIALALFYDVGQ